MNKYTGEVDVKLGDKTYKLVFNWKAIAEYQSEFGIDAQIESFTINQIARVLQIGLSTKHPEVTIDDIMDASPPMGYITDCIIEAFIYAQHGAENGGKIVEEARRIVEETEKKTKSLKV